MAELSTVARPYAEALFAAARDDKAGLQAWADLVSELSQVASNPDVREAMADPRLGDKQRVELSDAQVQELVVALEKKFGLKLKPVVTVDQSLIGGVRVAVGDQVLDTSVQAQLARMRDTLAA